MNKKKMRHSQRAAARNNWRMIETNQKSYPLTRGNSLILLIPAAGRAILTQLIQ